jgi:hypothetical protein
MAEAQDREIGEVNGYSPAKMKDQCNSNFSGGTSSPLATVTGVLPGWIFRPQKRIFQGQQPAGRIIWQPYRRVSTPCSSGKRPFAGWRIGAEAAIVWYWGCIQAFPFGGSEYRQALRQAFLGRLRLMLSDRSDFYHPPDMCRGYLHLLLADYAAAERDLRPLALAPVYSYFV